MRGSYCTLGCEHHQREDEAVVAAEAWSDVMVVPTSRREGPVSADDANLP